MSPAVIHNNRKMTTSSNKDDFNSVFSGCQGGGTTFGNLCDEKAQKLQG